MSSLRRSKSKKTSLLSRKPCKKKKRKKTQVHSAPKEVVVRKVRARKVKLLVKLI